MTQQIIQTYYISTGKLNAMYTLRMSRQVLNSNYHVHDNYICNLAATEDKAVEKAANYVEAMRQRFNDTTTFKIVFDDSPEFEVGTRRSKLSTMDTRKLETIEQGLFPFGKHSGTRIEDAPSSYVLYFADMITKETDDIVSQALYAACAGVALEKGYIAKRDAVRAEIKAVNILSKHIGALGERLVIEGVIFSQYYKQSADFDEDGYYITKIRQGDDIVVYIGSKNLGDKDTTIKMKATVKKHETYQDVASTVVNRPALIVL